MNLSAKKLCSVVKGRFVQQWDHSFFTGVSTDSREPDLTGKIFFALKGSHFDGHNFLTTALEKRASALIIDEAYGQVSISSAPINIIQVKDTLKALQLLASYWREALPFKVIGITGSSGKTTTKFFCKALLEKSFSVKVSPKSFNNQYGVPLSLLSVGEDTDFLIQEIGMNRAGEIAFLSKMAQPNIVAVTQVGDSHIGFLKSRKNIAREKEQIYLSCHRALPVFNMDNPYTKVMYEHWKKHRPAGHQAFVFSSQDETADLFLQVTKVEKARLSVSGHIQGVKGSAVLSITGPVHLNNIMCAGTLALATGLKEQTIWQNLSLCRLPPGRLQWIKLVHGAEVLFDGYNASPESVIALLNHFLSSVVLGKKILVLGDFLELGTLLEKVQKQVAEKVAKSDVWACWLIGEQADSLACVIRRTGCSAQIYVSRHFNPAKVPPFMSGLDSSVVLAFKGSRGNRLERVLKHFQPRSMPIF